MKYVTEIIIVFAASIISAYLAHHLTIRHSFLMMKLSTHRELLRLITKLIQYQEEFADYGINYGVEEMLIGTGQGPHPQGVILRKIFEEIFNSPRMAENSVFLEQDILEGLLDISTKINKDLAEMLRLTPDKMGEERTFLLMELLTTDREYQTSCRELQELTARKILKHNRTFLGLRLE